MQFLVQISCLCRLIIVSSIVPQVVFQADLLKREGKASDNEIFTSRLVDRVLRPLFPSNYHAEVLCSGYACFSADGVDQPDALAGFAASAAMACSDIPFDCPISEVRVARINGEYVINPTIRADG
jgi:polyribonucleotide nucleotidyltransferase